MAPNPFDDEAPETGPEKAAEATTVTPPGQHTEDEPSRLSVTLKAGKGYEAPWIRLEGPSVFHVLSLFKGWSVVEVKAKFPVASDALAALLKEVNGAGSAFQNDYEGRGAVSAPRTNGKPANANTTPAASAEPDFDSGGGVPFGNDSTPNTPDPMLACEHGTRKLIEWQGAKYHVCPLGKGKPGYCGAVKG